MAIDYEKWHDGVGYRLNAAATPGEREVIEAILLRHGRRDWRDAGALAKLATPAARSTSPNAAASAAPEIRLAVTRYASLLVSDEQRTVSCAAELAERSTRPRNLIRLK